ncbi:hypothetical protein [Chroococcidiopsis sp.]|uniref:hypothetical protein n=1 Tax=Chroococcidiopsis sp. TaxID=3088168 RepID=UPI003F3A80AF
MTSDQLTIHYTPHFPHPTPYTPHPTPFLHWQLITVNCQLSSRSVASAFTVNQQLTTNDKIN